LNIEACKTRRGAKQVKERNEVSKSEDVSGQPGKWGLHKLHSPDEGKNRWRNTKGDEIGERIEFPPKITRRIRHPRNATVQTIKKDRKANRFRRGGEMLVRTEISARDLQGSLKGLNDCQKAEKDIAAGK
jgi:hypothetical protein